MAAFFLYSGESLSSGRNEFGFGGGVAVGRDPLRLESAAAFPVGPTQSA